MIKTIAKGIVLAFGVFVCGVLLLVDFSEETKRTVGALLLGGAFLAIFVGLGNSFFIGLPWDEFIPWPFSKNQKKP